MFFEKTTFKFRRDFKTTLWNLCYTRTVLMTNWWTLAYQLMINWHHFKWAANFWLKYWPLTIELDQGAKEACRTASHIFTSKVKPVSYVSPHLVQLSPQQWQPLLQEKPAIRARSKMRTEIEALQTVYFCKNAKSGKRNALLWNGANILWTMAHCFVLFSFRVFWMTDTGAKLFPVKC